MSKEYNNNFEKNEPVGVNYPDNEDSRETYGSDPCEYLDNEENTRRDQGKNIISHIEQSFIETDTRRTYEINDEPTGTRVYDIKTGALLTVLNDSLPAEDHFCDERIYYIAKQLIKNKLSINEDEVLTDPMGTGKYARMSKIYSMALAIVIRAKSTYYIGDRTRRGLEELALQQEEETYEGYGIMYYTPQDKELQIESKPYIERFPPFDFPLGQNRIEKQNPNTRSASSVRISMPIAQEIAKKYALSIDQTKSNTDKIIAFDVHTHGDYSLKHKGASTEANKMDVLNQSSESDSNGSGVQAVLGFQNSVVATKYGYTIYTVGDDKNNEQQQGMFLYNGKLHSFSERSTILYNDKINSSSE